MSVYDTYNEYTTLWEFVPKGEPRTVANQIAAAARVLVTNWLNNGGTIWDTDTNPFSDHPCQSCADWLYKYAGGADTIIGAMNKQPFAGRSELYTEVMDFDDENDWSENLEAYGFKDGDIDFVDEKSSVEEYDKLLDGLLYRFNNDYDGLKALDKIPAIDSIDSCQGPVYKAATVHQD